MKKKSTLGENPTTYNLDKKIPPTSLDEETYLVSHDAAYQLPHDEKLTLGNSYHDI